ncbi:MAG TPA: EcsC family protein [Burkholderiaceae bacterium]|nr:EcsC family protein [Burkholderiaceae bacterium]
MNESDIAQLRTAKALLERPSLAARVSSFVGAPIEKGLEMLPERWKPAVDDTVRRSIEMSLELALRTLDVGRAGSAANRLHKLAAGASGAVGGAFGLPALAFELPLSTTIIMRSIADIARGEGEDLASTEARLQCVQVLALGGASKHDDAAETGYFAARAAMAKAVSEAVAHLARHGLAQQGAPALVRLVAQVASRFSVVVSEKAAAQAVPVVGALGGALINTVFIDHFQDVGRGHFTVRRFERLYGPQPVRRLYETL